MPPTVAPVRRFRRTAVPASVRTPVAGLRDVTTSRARRGDPALAGQPSSLGSPLAAARSAAAPSRDLSNHACSSTMAAALSMTEPSGPALPPGRRQRTLGLDSREALVSRLHPNAEGLEQVPQGRHLCQRSLCRRSAGAGQAQRKTDHHRAGLDLTDRREDGRMVTGQVTRAFDHAPRGRERTPAVAVCHADTT